MASNHDQRIALFEPQRTVGHWGFAHDVGLSDVKGHTVAGSGAILQMVNNAVQESPEVVILQCRIEQLLGN